ncbi:MAG: glycosyltransferase family 4 protein [Nitrospirae bacterium]|nr:glycosyltransferase family 4 protein [Nitrospirota bacterium]
MKIALIRKNFTPYGGAENYMMQTASALAGRGHEVHILSAGDWPEEYFIFHKINTVSGPSFLSNTLFASNVKKALGKEAFDSVISFERAAGGDIYRAGDGCHKEWLSRRGEYAPFHKRISFLINPHHRMLLYLEKKRFENSKLIIANSKMVKNDIIRNYSVDPEKIRVIYNGVDLRKFHPVDADKKAAVKYSIGLQEKKVILFAGADLERKGLPALLRAFLRMERKGMMILVAGKKAGGKFASLIKRLGIKKSVLLWGTEKDMTKLYAASDILVLPTIYDPFSNASLEAMASGLPVVTTSANGVSELITNGVEGYVIKNPSDSDTLAKMMSAALSNSLEMGSNARKKAEGFPIEKAVDEIVRLISENVQRD